ncbi:MAG: ComF family protein [Desulfobulbaceae bacterium]|nr:ComF family protein [Desulfobulbaceae bacterium]
MRKNIRFFFEPLQELIFPSSCLECEQRLPCRELPLLCNDCLADISFPCSPCCPCCGMPFSTGQDHFCGLCLKKSFAFDLARAALHYTKPVTSLIGSLKFNGTLTGLASLAYLARNAPGRKDLHEPDLVLPVPLHMQRLRQRKFNQALVIGKACFPDYRSSIRVDILIRHRATAPQTALNGTERRKNLSGAFSLTNPDLVKNKMILLVDDVFTTGSTVNECAKVLRRAGAKRIEVFTVARAI